MPRQTLKNLLPPDPRIQPQSILVSLAWMGFILVLTATVPITWSATVKTVAYNRVPVGLAAVVLASVLMYTNYQLRLYVARTRPDWAEILKGLDFTIFGAVLTSLSNNLTLRYYEPRPVLDDFGFWLIPEVLPDNPVYIVSDLLVDCMGPAVLFYCLFWVEDPYQRARLGKSCFARVGAAQGLRAFSTFITRMPGPALHCRPGPYTLYQRPADVVEMVTQFGHMLGAVKNCGDLIFSGHGASLMAVASVLVGHMLLNKSLFMQRVIKFCATLYLGTFAVLVVACRKHYSVDLVVAYMLIWVMDDKFDDPWKYLYHTFIPHSNPTPTPGQSGRPGRPRTKSNFDDTGFDAELAPLQSVV